MTVVSSTLNFLNHHCPATLESADIGIVKAFGRCWHIGKKFLSDIPSWNMVSFLTRWSCCVLIDYRMLNYGGLSCDRMTEACVHVHLSPFRKLPCCPCWFLPCLMCANISSELTLFHGCRQILAWLAN